MQGTISITLDGVNIQDNHLKTGDGFFARTYPRQDAIEEVTVTTANQGADAAGQGGVQIRFQTRSGTNRYETSVYHYFRHPSLNTNYFFNKKNGLGKNEVILHQYGGRIGGPIIIPGVYDGRGKAFFFFNHEEFYNPSEATRTRTILRESARTGIFSYSVGGQARQVDLLSLVPQVPGLAGGAMDPTVAALLLQIRNSTGVTGAVSDLADLNTQRFIFQNAGQQNDHQPTVKIDYNLSTAHRLSGSYTWLHVLRNPDFLNSADPAFPNFPNYRTQDSYRPSGSTWLRSTFGPNMVNELRFGGSWGPTWFGRNITAEQFENQGGFSLGLNTVPNAQNSAISSATITAAPSARSAYNWNIDNTLNWQRGAHSLSFGGSFQRIDLWLQNWSVVPSISFGVVDGDPATALFNTTNFPGASNAQLNDARDLFAVLTGRVNQVGGTGRLNEDTGLYEYNGTFTNRALMDDWGFFAQDSWRMKPNFTVSAGVRWEAQLPFKSKTDVMSTATFADLCGVSGVAEADTRCNIFQPGTLTGIQPQFIQYTAGTKGYNTDWNNFAPNVGFAWQPNVQDGFLRSMLGDPAQATVRGGYSVSYSRNGTSDFTGVYGSNPGDTTGANRNVNNGNLLLPGSSYPVLLRNRDALGPPATCAPGTVSAACMTYSPIFPIQATTADDINIFDPNLQVSFARSYSIGLQRSLGKDMAFEIRYVGTRNVAGWTTENWNETNIIENNFYNEYGLAVQNLRANIAAGRGNTVAFTGAPGTTPLPTYLAYITGRGNALAGDPANYTGSFWTDSDLLALHAFTQPSAVSAAGELTDSATRRSNAILAGLAPNHFVLNPSVGDANITQSESFSKYHSLQFDLRRRFSRGLAVNFNYTYARRWGSSNLGQRYGRILTRNTGNPQAWKMTWNYELPVGQGRRFMANSSTWLDAIVGGWSFDGAGRWQTRTVNLGNVRLVGMTVDELQREYRIRIDDATRTVTMLPADIIENTRRAYNTSATSATGYSTALGVPEGRYIAPANNQDCYQFKTGDCAPIQTFLNAPMFARFDMSLKKKFRLGRRATFDLQFDVLNVFDAINFNPVANPGTGATIFEVTSAYTDLSNTFDPGGRLGQVVWRISW